MKRYLIILFASFIFSGTIAQNSNLDPSYSTRNYKHPNKVKIAKRQKVDRGTTFGSMVYPGGSEYKHKHNQSWVSVRATVRTKQISKSRVTAKHPLG